MWGTQCPPPSSVWFRFLDLAVATTQKETLGLLLQAGCSGQLASQAWSYVSATHQCEDASAADCLLLKTRIPNECPQKLAGISLRVHLEDSRGHHRSVCEAAGRCDSCSSEPVSGPVLPVSRQQGSFHRLPCGLSVTSPGSLCVEYSSVT